MARNFDSCRRFAVASDAECALTQGSGNSTASTHTPPRRTAEEFSDHERRSCENTIFIMTLDSLTDLLLEELQDIYDAEQQLARALPLMAEKAFSPDLKALFEEHLEQTKEHASRLETAFKKLKAPVRGKPCHAMRGIVVEAEELLEQEQKADPTVLDAALVGAAQKAEHYEIAAYGTIRTYARTLKAAEIAKLFQQTLDEEAETDRKLTALAEESVNLDAAESDSEIQKEAASNP